MPTDMSPTAANILSSLCVKGAVVRLPAGQGPEFKGFLPVLNEDGKVDVSLIPSGGSETSVQRLSNVLIVDPGTTCTSSTGSVACPFKTVSAAAAAFTNDPGSGSAERCAILLMPGRYADSSVAFAASPLQAFVICLGACSFTASTVSFSGLRSGGTLFLQNIAADGNVSVGAGCTKVVCLGTTYVAGTLGVQTGAEVSVSSEALINATNGVKSYLSSTAMVGNSSSGAAGATAKDAIDGLAARKVRVYKVIAGHPCVVVDGYEDIPAAGGVYDLRRHDEEIVAALNGLADRIDNQVVDTVSATSVTADEVSAGTVRADALHLGGNVIRVDEFGYLVVDYGGSGSSSDSSSDSGSDPSGPVCSYAVVSAYNRESDRYGMTTVTSAPGNDDIEAYVAGCYVNLRRSAEGEWSVVSYDTYLTGVSIECDTGVGVYCDGVVVHGSMGGTEYTAYVSANPGDNVEVNVGGTSVKLRRLMSGRWEIAEWSYMLNSVYLTCADDSSSSDSGSDPSGPTCSSVVVSAYNLESDRHGMTTVTSSPGNDDIEAYVAGCRVDLRRSMNGEWSVVSHDTYLADVSIECDTGSGVYCDGVVVHGSMGGTEYAEYASANTGDNVEVNVGGTSVKLRRLASGRWEIAEWSYMLDNVYLTCAGDSSSSDSSSDTVSDLV